MIEFDAIDEGMALGAICDGGWRTTFAQEE